MATAKKKKTAKKKTNNSFCAQVLGRKGGLATKKKKVGIFSPTYKRKKTTAKKRK